MKRSTRIKNTFYIATALTGIAFFAGAMLSAGTSHAADNIKAEKSGNNFATKTNDLEFASVNATIAASNPSETFIANISDKAIGTITDSSLDDVARQDAFRDLLSDNFDMKTIGRFVLGKYWNQASSEQRDEYFNLFENMIVKTYTKRFSEYSGQKLVVVGSRAEGDKDMLVNSLIKGGGSDIHVDWRVREKKDGSRKVVDVIVEGVSMSITQRSDFSSVINRNGGNFDALLSHLREG